MASLIFQKRFPDAVSSLHRPCIASTSCTSYRSNIATTKHTNIYNAITLNKREIDRVHKNEKYIATVSIKQKAVDCIKTALRSWFNATRISSRMASKTMTFVTSISTIFMEPYVNEQTDKKKMILQRSALSEQRYRRFRLRSDSRTCCQNKQNGGQRSSTLVSK